VPAGGDDDVGQGVRRTGDVRDLLAGGEARQRQLEQPDRVPSVGDRDEHAGAAVVERPHVGLLGAQHALVPGAGQRQGLRLLDAVTPGALHLVRRRQPDDGPPGEIGDEEADLPGVDHLAEGGGNRLDGVDGRRGLDLRQERADVDHVSLRAAHAANPRRSGSIDAVVAPGEKTTLPDRP
jgi:hypothetical protein